MSYEYLENQIIIDGEKNGILPFIDAKDADEMYSMHMAAAARACMQEVNPKYHIGLVIKHLIYACDAKGVNITECMREYMRMDGVSL